MNRTPKHYFKPGLRRPTLCDFCGEPSEATVHHVGGAFKKKKVDKKIVDDEEKLVSRDDKRALREARRRWGKRGVIRKGKRTSSPKQRAEAKEKLRRYRDEM